MAGSIKQTSNNLIVSGTSVDSVVFEFEWTADAVDGSVPATAADVGRAGVQGFMPTNVEIIGFSPAPTSGYSVQIFNANNIDILGGAGVGITDTSLAIATASAIAPLYGSFTVVISGNIVPGAKGRIVLYVRRISLSQIVTPTTSASATSGSASTFPYTLTANYMWSRTPSVSLIGGNSSSVALTPMPIGITTASPNTHYLRITDPVGGNETVLVTARTASTVTFTPVLSHAAGNWAIGTATAGMQEAIYGTSSTSFVLPSGNIDYYQQAFVPRRIGVIGAWRYGSTIRLNSTTQNVFASTNYGMQVQNVGFSAVGVQTAGKIVSIIGSTIAAPGDGDIDLEGCEFDNIYDGAYAAWPGGFVRIINCMFRGVLRYAAYVNAGVGAAAVQICDNYMDGRPSPGLIWIEGTLAGGVIADNWMQASLAHIVINAVDGDPANELIITGNLLDQDTASTACVVVGGNGVAGSSSNCVKITSNFMASLNFGVLCQDAWNVSVTDNHIRQRGVSAAIVFGGTTCGKAAILNNVIECESGTPGYSIQISPTNMGQCVIQGNRGTSVATMNAFVGIATAISGNLHILGNSAGSNYTRMLVNVGSTGAGLGVMTGNVGENTPSVSVSAAASVTLPFVDESQVVAISATGTPITEINGILARAGRRVTFLVDGAITFATSSVADNKLGVGFGPTLANDSVTWSKYADNLWYVVGKS